MKNSIVVFTGVFLVVAFVIGGYFYKKSVTDAQSFMAKENYSVFVKDHSPTLGKKDAKVHIVEFFDPECGTCQAFHPYTKELLKKYDGKVKLTLRYVGFHKNSPFVLRIIESARRQGKFWETLDVMYASASYWGDHHNPKPERLWKVLPRVEGLNVEKLKADMYLPEVQKTIDLDLADVKTLNVRKTPTFFVNGKPLPKFGYKELEDLVASEIKAMY